VEERKSVAIRAGLEALCVMLKLCSNPACPRHLLNQESLETCCKFLAQQARCSLMVFFDATLALEARPGADRAHNRPTYAHPITRSEPFISWNAVPANFIYLKVYVPFQSGQLTSQWYHIILVAGFRLQILVCFPCMCLCVQCQ
jgi:hypothetical protein